jgi:gas vesicle protein
MRLALDEERKNRDQLLGELTRTRTALSDQDQQIKNPLRANLQSKEQQAARLAEEQANLQRQVAAPRNRMQRI